MRDCIFIYVRQGLAGTNQIEGCVALLFKMRDCIFIYVRQVLVGTNQVSLKLQLFFEQKGEGYA